MRRLSPLLRSTISSEENTSSDASTAVPRQGIGPVVRPRADNSSAVNIQFGCAGESARRSFPSICAYRWKLFFVGAQAATCDVRPDRLVSHRNSCPCLVVVRSGSGCGRFPARLQ